MNTYRRSGGIALPFLTSALDGDEGSVSHLAALLKLDKDANHWLHYTKTWRLLLILTHSVPWWNAVQGFNTRAIYVAFSAL